MDPDSVFVMVKFHPPGSGGQQRGPQTGEDGFWVVVPLIGWIDIPLVVRQQVELLVLSQIGQAAAEQEIQLAHPYEIRDDRLQR